MKREYVINTKKLINSGLSPNFFLFLQALFHKDEDMLKYLKNVDLEYLQSNNYIRIINISVSAEDFIDDVILLDKSKNLFINSESEEKVFNVENWYQDYRRLFAGTKPGAMGDKKATLKKLQKFLKDNPEYTVEDIFNITREYIDSFQGNYKYLQQADYFIYKEDTNKIVRSRLLTLLEEKGSNFEPKQDAFRREA